MAARLARRPVSREHAPRALLARCHQPHRLDCTGGRRHRHRDRARLHVLTGGIAHVRIERHPLPHLRLLGREEQTHPLSLGHGASVGHPANDLPPEAVVVFVLDTLPPPPCAIGGHEEHLAGAERPRDEQRDPAVVVGHVVVHGEHLAARLRAEHRTIPLKARQRFPDGDVFVA